MLLVHYIRMCKGQDYIRIILQWDVQNQAYPMQTTHEYCVPSSYAQLIHVLIVMPLWTGGAI